MTNIKKQREYLLRLNSSEFAYINDLIATALTTLENWYKCMQHWKQIEQL